MTAPADTAAIVEFRGVHKAFAGHSVLRGLNLAVRAGEVLYIIGTSGVGKSVALRHLIGLVRPDQGEVWALGRRIDTLSEAELYPVRRRVGMVFQNSTLFDSMTLRENVALPLRKHKGMREREAQSDAERRLQEVHMHEFADRYPAELSDGMRKRAAIARALTLEPEVVLFDEPTTGLDPVSARRIDRLMRELADSHHVTAVVVSHDLVSIFAVANRIAFLYDGAIHALGTPDEIRTSQDPILTQFIRGQSKGPMKTPGF